MKNLKILRSQRNITQKELANALCVTQTSISDWERQRNLPHIDIITQVAKFFGVTIDYLIGLEPDSGLIYVHKDPALSDTEKQLIAEFRKSKRAAQKFILNLEDEEENNKSSKNNDL